MIVVGSCAIWLFNQVDMPTIGAQSPSRERDRDGLMEEIDHPFIHSEGDFINVRT
jgi:hypothetical protein